MTKTYVAKSEGFIAGKYREKGEIIGSLTERDAKYLVLNGQIAEQATKKTGPVKADTPSASSDRKQR